MESYTLIENTVKDSGHTLTREWLKDHREEPRQPIHFSDEEWQKISKENLEAIQKADAVIIEASVRSFSMGYMSALALARKKPLLMLFRSQQKPYILDAENSLKRAVTYNSNEELEQIVRTFLDEINVDANSLRFNMVLDHEIYNFLNWESVNTGKTKAQIIREVLKERIKQ